MLVNIQSQNMPVEQFQRDLNEICGSFETKATHGSTHIKGFVRAEERAGLEFAHVAKDLQTIKRTKRNIRQDASENYFLIVQEVGRALMSQRDTTRFLVPGDMMLIDSAEPSEFSFFGSFGRQISLHLPRDEMDKRFGRSLKGGMYLPRTDHITMAMGATLAKAFEPTGNETQSGYLREVMFGLIGAVLFERNSPDAAKSIDSEVSQSDLLARGIAYLDRLYKSNDLTIQSVAHDLGVSVRNLQRAFAMIDTTPTNYLLQRRLEYACQLLLERRAIEGGGSLVSSIAYAAGFNDVSYFNRQFRKYFNCAPGQFGFADTTRTPRQN